MKIIRDKEYEEFLKYKRAYGKICDLKFLSDFPFVSVLQDYLLGNNEFGFHFMRYTFKKLVREHCGDEDNKMSNLEIENEELKDTIYHLTRAIEIKKEIDNRGDLECSQNQHQQ